MHMPIAPKRHHSPLNITVCSGSFLSITWAAPLTSDQAVLFLILYEFSCKVLPPVH